VYPISQQHIPDQNSLAALPPQGIGANNDFAADRQSYRPCYLPPSSSATSYNQQGSNTHPSVGAVGINIYNPTVGGQSHGPYYGPNYATCPVPTQYVNQPVNQPTNRLPQTNLPNQQKQLPQQTQQAPQKQEPKQEEPKKDDTPKQAATLPIEYIKTLENYLNNSNTEVRLMGAKEILKRFKEDKSRTKDQALTNLLNKALQDQSQSVRMIALGTLSAGYTAGDDFTIQVLKNMQKSKDGYNQDALTASDILLKLSGKNLNVQSNSNQVEQTNTQKQTGKNLNVQSDSNQTSQDNQQPQVGKNLDVTAK